MFVKRVMMILKKFLLACVIIILVLPCNVFGLKLASDYVKSKDNTIVLSFYKIEYLEGNTINSENKKFKDLLSDIEISDIEIKDDFIEGKILFSGNVADNTSAIKSILTVKEYQNKELTEVKLESTFTGFLTSLKPSFTIDSEGSHFLLPNLYEPLVNFFGDETDGKWNVIFSDESSMVVDDNYLLYYGTSNKNILLITNKKISSMETSDKGDKWTNYHPIWKFEDIRAGENYSFKFWLTPLSTSIKDDILTIRLKASDMAHEILTTPKVIFKNETRGYDFIQHEVWYRFKKDENDWDIDPFTISPHTNNGEIVEDTSSVTIYLPENATAINGPEGYPAVFKSTGENAIGMYFKDSINGPRGKEDSWFGDSSAGGGFYIKDYKEGEVVKVYYITPAPKTIPTMNVSIPMKNLPLLYPEPLQTIKEAIKSELETKQIIVTPEEYLNESNAYPKKITTQIIVIDESYMRAAKRMMTASIILLILTFTALIYLIWKKE